VFRFLTKQHFLVNLLVAIILVGGSFISVLWMLGFITSHGAYEKVPSVAGIQVKDAIEALEAKGFVVEVQDSVWAEDKDPLTVIKQSPEADATVKAKRTIYLTVNRAQPPLISVPNLVGLSFRNAELYLKQLGLKLGDTLRKPDIARDAVLEQLYNGADIRPGTKVYQGSTLSFVLGSGLGGEEMEVPVLLGMTYAEVKGYLSQYGLNAGALIVDGDVKDTAAAYVYRQNPEKKSDLGEGKIQINRIRPGQSIDLWLGTTKIEIVQPDSLVQEPGIQ
jgi:eukaryotic-like serine/threonine-protein kinase